MNAEKKSTVYFPGLDSLRFLAAFSVVIYHIELEKKNFHVTENFPNAFVQFIGPVAVTFFFVLSGFLITYLLFVEKRKFNTISVRQFYVRRILRIWPLYYMVIILGVVVLHHLPLFQQDYLVFQYYPWYVLLMFFTFFSNLGLAVISAGATSFPPSFINHTWSIGVEEQFYLFWPWLIKLFKKPLRAILGVIVVIYIVKFAVSFAYGRYPTHLLDITIEFLRATRFECMAIGAIGAYLVFFHREKIPGWIFSFPVRASVLITILTLFYYGVTIPGIQNIMYSTLFCYMILYVSLFNGIKILSFLTYFGKISYGIYMYHPIIIIGVTVFLKNHLTVFENNFTLNILLYSLGITLTILVSSLSYHFYELPFLKLKKRFYRLVS